MQLPFFFTKILVNKGVLVKGFYFGREKIFNILIWENLWKAATCENSKEKGTGRIILKCILDVTRIQLAEDRV
jgi:hypothetical protein